MAAKKRSTASPANERKPTDVEWFSVCVERMVDGKLVINDSLSPNFSSLAKAKEAFNKISQNTPTAYIGGGVRFFNPNRPGSMDERERFIRSLA